ncbi:hypothetical protein HW44_02105 [Nitrosococcus oceani]|nr:hypothetical protein HW44_02105 [Nitrosococcus oceani]
MAYGPGVVTTIPKCGKPGSEDRKFFSQFLARGAFEPVNHFRHTPTRIKLNEQVDMIRHNFQSMNCHFKFIRLLVEQGTKAFGNLTHKNPAAIFGAPHKVQFKTKNRPGIFGVSTHLAMMHSPETYFNNFTTGGERFRCQLKQAVPALNYI